MTLIVLTAYNQKLSDEPSCWSRSCTLKNYPNSTKVFMLKNIRFWSGGETQLSEVQTVLARKVVQPFVQYRR